MALERKQQLTTAVRRVRYISVYGESEFITMKHVGAAAGTMVALVSCGVAEGFSIAAPNPTSRTSSSISTCSTGSGAAATTSIARIDHGQTPSTLPTRSSTCGIRQNIRAGKLRLQSEAGGAPAEAAAAGTGQQRRPGVAAATAGARRRPPQRQQRKTVSSVEGAIQNKRMDEMDELKEKLQREHAELLWLVQRDSAFMASLHVGLVPERTCARRRPGMAFN